MRWKLAFFVSSPFEVNSGDVEHDSFEPEDHEEALREGTVADAFSIISGLNDRQKVRELKYIVHKQIACTMDGLQ